MLNQTITQLPELLEQSAARHKHLCPRQVLGVRMGMQIASLFGLTLPQTNKRLFTFVETDGCFADGVSVATGCWLGRRTMRLMDYGKTAATFVDTKTEQAIRIWANPNCRQLAADYVPKAQSRWHMMLEAYQIMPADELLCWRNVELTLSIKEIISRAGVRVNCQICGEEIINEREVHKEGLTLCRSCAGDSYYSFESMDMMDYFKDGCC
ncbi:MAG: formylmethanofuran dehydrogenase [Chloroflexi bacterium]|nr:MAG: formylmethanofuran dehydrogenase [Chloroflexota bacterium]